MGQPKALLPLNGQAALRRCLAVMPGAVGDIIVILGLEMGAAATLLEGMPVKIVINTRPGSDMAASVRLGFQAMDPESAGALVCLVDHPLVRRGTLRQLAAKALEAPDRVIIPTFQGRRGHPSVFPRAMLMELYQGLNLREIIGRHPDKVTLLPVEDEGVILDMDTPADYQALCRRLEEENYEP